MAALVEKFDDIPDRDKQAIMGNLLDRVEIHEKKQPNGIWVKKIRFKIPLSFPDGKVYDEVSFVTEDSLPKETTDETVVLLSKGIDISTGKVQVEFSVEDMDLSAAHGNVSYNKIKKHVYEKTGLQVSNLNIAQVKRKYGIIERENYNLPKSENSKQPNCTPEKEKAIVAALQYFNMIG